MEVRLKEALLIAQRRYEDAKRNSRATEEKVHVIQRQLFQLQTVIQNSAEVVQRRELKTQFEVVECEAVAATNALQAVRDELRSAQVAVQKAEQALRDYEGEVKSLTCRFNAFIVNIRLHKNELHNMERVLKKARERLAREQAEREAIQQRLALLTKSEQVEQVAA